MKMKNILINLSGLGLLVACVYGILVALEWAFYYDWKIFITMLIAIFIGIALIDDAI